jgi:pimeloyl-ACP methyl ester carboxylesterase
MTVLATRLNINGFEMAVEEHGSGYPLVFSHDYGSNHRTWDEQISRFAREYRCITYSSRGFPPSEIPEDVQSYSSDLVIDDLLALLDALDIERAHLVGVSAGSNIVLQAAMKCPERCSAVVVGSAGTGSIDREAFLEHIGGLGKLARLGKMDEVAQRFSEGPFLRDFKIKNECGWQQFRDRMAELSALGWANAVDGVLLKRPVVADLADGFRSCKTPALIMAGDNDATCVEPAHFMHERLSNSALAIVPRSGHFLHLEEPELFNTLVAAFLRRVESGNWDDREARD